jgi:SpoIIAA-like
MLHFELLRDRNILIVAPDGPLEKADFEHLAKELDPVIASKETLTGLLVYVAKFPGWKNFGAFASHLKFIADHHRQIERIAALTNSRNLKAMSRIAGYFVHPNIKHFDLEQETQALAWLETGY